MVKTIRYIDRACCPKNKMIMRQRNLKRSRGGIKSEKKDFGSEFVDFVNTIINPADTEPSSTTTTSRGPDSPKPHLRRTRSAGSEIFGFALQDTTHINTSISGRSLLKIS